MVLGRDLVHLQPEKIHTIFGCGSSDGQHLGVTFNGPMQLELDATYLG